MKRTIKRLKAAHTEIKRRRKARTDAIGESVRTTVRGWMGRSRDVALTLPTAKELHEEFAEWRDDDSINLNEIGNSGYTYA